MTLYIKRSPTSVQEGEKSNQSKKLTNDRISLFSIDNGWIGFTSVDFLLAHAFSSSSFSRDTMIQY